MASDECRLVFEVAQADLGNFKKSLSEVDSEGEAWDCFDEESAIGNGTVFCVINDALGALGHEFHQVARKHKITFCGNHDGGGTFPQGAFVACSGTIVWLATDFRHEEPLLKIGQNLSADYDEVFMIALFYEIREEVYLHLDLMALRKAA